MKWPVITSTYSNLTVVGTVEVLGLCPWWEGEGADGTVRRRVPRLQHEAQEGALRAPHQLHIHAPARPHSQAGHLRGHAQGSLSITRINLNQINRLFVCFSKLGTFKLRQV
jgi:hypothetical protein